MEKVRIQVLTALWHRPGITELCFTGLQRLQEYKPDLFDINVTAVCSEQGRRRAQVERFGFEYIHAPNNPLGGKWHAGLQACLEHEFDYLMLMGSDDIVTSNILDAYGPLIENRTYQFGMRDMFVYSTNLNEMVYFPGYYNQQMSIGACRMIHRHVIETCGNKLWKTSRSRGLDGSALARVQSFGFGEALLSCGPSNCVLVDIKSKQNLNRFEHFTGQRVSPSKILAHFPEKERYMIASLTESA